MFIIDHATDNEWTSNYLKNWINKQKKDSIHKIKFIKSQNYKLLNYELLFSELLLKCDLNDKFIFSQNLFYLLYIFQF